MDKSKTFVHCDEKIKSKVYELATKYKITHRNLASRFHISTVTVRQIIKEKTLLNAALPAAQV